MTSRRSTLASFLTLGLLAAIGAILIFMATPDGLGLSDDSIAYVAGARSLLAGNGYREAWLESNGPVTHFPPGFSGALTLIGLAGIDPLNGARLLNTALFGVNAALLGLLGWRMTKSSVAGIVAAALFVVNDSLLRVHAVAMSEPLFLFFSLLAFLCFDISLSPRSDDFSRRTNKFVTTWLLVTGLLASLAYLTRYSGLALVATFVFALIILNDTWKKRLTSAAIFLASFAPLVIAWSIRNRIVAGNATNRTTVWHPVTAEKLEQGLRTFSEFLVPVEEWRQALFKSPGIFVGIIIVISLAVLSWLLVNGLRRVLKPSTPLPEAIGFTNGLYIFGYMASIFASISLFDASTPLKVRILAPAYVSLLLLLVNAGMWMWRRWGSAGRVAVGVAAALVFSVSALGQGRTVAELSKGGTGYASFKWYDSKVMAYLRELPAGTIIYTNEPGAVYLYTGHPCRVLPSRIDPVTGLEQPNFEQGAETIRRQVQSGYGFLVLFDADETSPDVALLTEGLYPILKSGGDVIYYAPPP
ncbi:MAG: phospholipid carrier-dependent glycosyltransferase [Chloroflexota bacterium]